MTENWPDWAHFAFGAAWAFTMVFIKNNVRKDR